MEETLITKYGWIARNGTGKLMYFKGDAPPKRSRLVKQWDGGESPVNGIPIGKKQFPELTWEDEPIRVAVTIRPLMELENLIGVTNKGPKNPPTDCVDYFN